MSDFLSDLVGRSFAGGSSVRPQQPSLFESPSTNSSGTFFAGAEMSKLSPAQEEAGESSDRISRLEPALGPAKSVGIRADSETLPRTISGEDQPRVVPPGERSESAGLASANAEEATGLRPVAAGVRSEVGPAPGPSAKQPEKALPEEGRDSVIEFKTDAKKRSAARLSSPSPTARNADNSVPRKPIGNHGAEEAEENIQRGIHERAERRVPTPVRDLRAATSRPTSARVPVSPPHPNDPAVVPSIQVTIGRVEVRATLAPTPPKAPRPSAAVLDLDEYLRKRATGDRR